MTDMIEINLKFTVSSVLKTFFSNKLKEIELEQIILSNFKLDEYDKRKLNILCKNNNLVRKNQKTDSIKEGATYEFCLDKVLTKLFEKKEKLLYFCPFIPPNEIVIRDKIAEGGFGEIYECIYENGEIGKNYVFKNLKIEDDIILKSFFQEVATYSRLNHPNIPKFMGITYEIFNKNGFVMEYIRGENLLQFVDKGKLTCDRMKLNIIYQLSDVLCYLHQNNIIHRDLKPDNIIILKENNDIRIYLLDYGLSQIINNNQNVISSFISYFQYHTHVYQYLQGNELFKYNSFDVWSYGCIVYFLYTGRHPYDKNTIKMANSINNKQNFFTKEEINDDFIYDLIDQCCKLDPNERISIEKIKSLLFRKIHVLENHQIEVKLDTQKDLDLKSMLVEFSKCDKPSHKSIDLAYCIGEEYLDKLNYEESLKFHELSLNYKIKLRIDPFSQADSYQKLGDLYTKETIKNIQESKKNYIKALNIKEMYNNYHNICQFYYEYALFLYNTGDIRSSMYYHKKAYEMLEICQKGNNDNILLAAHAYRIGFLSRIIEDYNQSLEYLQVAKSIYFNLSKGHIMISEICYEIGLTLFYLSRYTETVEYLEKLEAFLNSRIKKQTLLLNVLTVLGSTYCILFQYERAEKYFMRALDILKFAKNSIQYGICLNNLAIVYKHTSRSQKALHFFNDSLDIFKKNFPRNDNMIELTSCNIGLTYLILGDHYEAIINYLNSLHKSILINGDLSLKTADCHYNLGSIFMINNYSLQEASDHFEKAFSLRIKNLQENHLDIALIYYNRALVAIFSNDLINYRPFLEKSINVLNNIYSEPNVYSILFYHNIGKLLFSIDVLDESIYYLEKELRLSILLNVKINIAFCYQLIGKAYIKKKDLNKALSYMEKGSNLILRLYSDKDKKAKEFFENIGEIYKELGDIAKAEEFFAKAF